MIYPYNNDDEGLRGIDENGQEKGSALRTSITDGSGTSYHSRNAAGNRDTPSYGNGTSTVYAYKSGDPR